jgi:hypothetical protein
MVAGLPWFLGICNTKNVSNCCGCAHGAMANKAIVGVAGKFTNHA